jgi:methylmalonyl-CoA mutase
MATLNGAQLATLSKASDDGIPLGPIHVAYRRETRVAQRSAAWSIVQAIDDPDARRASLLIDAEIAGGAGGLSFVGARSAAGQRLGYGLDDGLAAPRRVAARLGDLHLRLEDGFASYSDIDSFLGIRARSTTFAFDPLAEAAALGGFPQPWTEIESRLSVAARALEWHDRQGAAVIADGRVWHAAGASEAQELAGVLAALAHYARGLSGAGIPVAASVARVGIALAADAHTLLTVAKTRAARLLHARFVEALGCTPSPANIHAETAWRMMTRRGVHLNMLRTASAALAAGIGGADSIGVLPFSAANGLPDAFARRLARNSQIILIEESGMARVGDPGAGSGTIESVSEALAEKAWERFRAIEAEGGLLAALRSGSFQQDIAAMRDKRAAAIAAGDGAILGVTAYAAQGEERSGLADALASPARPPAVAETIAASPPMRLAAAFEGLHSS